MKNANLLFLKTTVLIALFISSHAISSFAQTFTSSHQLEWTKESILQNPSTQDLHSIWSADECQLYHQHPEIPRFVKRIALPSFGEIKIDLLEKKANQITLNDPRSISFLKPQYDIRHHIEQERNSYYAVITVLPFKSDGNSVSQLGHFDLAVSFRALPKATVQKDPTTTLSKLGDGAIYKIAVTEEGMQRLDRAFLQELGIDVNNLDTRKIQILGNGGGVVTPSLEEDRLDDLVENSIFIQGGTDGSFDENDFILFYGEASDRWEHNGFQYDYVKNVFDVNNYYFIKIGSSNGKRIQSISDIGTGNYQFDSYDHLIRYEEDKTNLLGSFGLLQGSGQSWYGDHYDITREIDYSSFFQVPDIISNSEADISMRFAGRSGSISNVQLLWNNREFAATIASSQTEDVESIYAKVKVISETIDIDGLAQNVKVRYPSNGNENEGWLDYIQMISQRSLKMLGDQVTFSNQESRNYSSAQLQISGIDTNTDIWNITEIDNAHSLAYSQLGGVGSFGFETNSEVQKFIAFNRETAGHRPDPIGPIENQNLHAIENVEFIILYHPDFKEAAERLATHRTNHNPLMTTLVDINQVYNEFSSGRVDPGAIRDFAKMIYDRTDNFRYLLLFGDGSYDYRHLDISLIDQNYIPVYETPGSRDPIESFPTDDFFALLSDDEGENLVGALDIAVGRIPARSLEDANTVVTKIIHYETSPTTFGDWRLKLLFNADDEDTNTHLSQANGIANNTKVVNPVYNIQKNYWDAYVQETTPGGDRYPGATAALNKAVESGVLLCNYLGHGGSKGWSQERVLKASDIQAYTNYDRLTTFITATCSFTGYDDPALVTAGELCLSNPSGAAVALLTTTRAVYISGNKRLTEAVFDTIFTKENGESLRLGEIMRRAKNTNSGDTLGTNARKFAMIGDPTIRLAIPKLGVTTTKVNGTDVSVQADTIRALQKVSIEGFINNEDGTVNTNFNGILSPTVYDKESTIFTLGNDSPTLIRSFQVQKNILFKGSVSVTNGKFAFSFVVPEDINYEYGYGKISYYATDNQSIDAAGFYNNVIIGGTDTNAVADDQGPEISLFMDNTDFVYGGTTNQNTTLLVHLSDDNGINISGTSIGHDLKGTLDDDQQNSFILNEYYTSNLDDYTSGKVSYPLSDLELGMHKIHVKAWDISNNSNEEIIEFVVINDEGGGLEHVLNYPNPFTTSTRFQFDTDLVNTPLDVLINIYTLSGKVVKTIQTTANAAGGRVSDINWNGNDDYESSLAKGVYLYKIKVSSDQFNSSRESEFEKLVILK